MHVHVALPLCARLPCRVRLLALRLHVLARCPVLRCCPVRTQLPQLPYPAFGYLRTCRAVVGSSCVRYPVNVPSWFRLRVAARVLLTPVHLPRLRYLPPQLQFCPLAPSSPVALLTCLAAVARYPGSPRSQLPVTPVPVYPSCYLHFTAACRRAVTRVALSFLPPAHFAALRSAQLPVALQFGYLRVAHAHAHVYVLPHVTRLLPFCSSFVYVWLVTFYITVTFTFYTFTVVYVLVLRLFVVVGYVCWFALPFCPFIYLYLAHARTFTLPPARFTRYTHFLHTFRLRVGCGLLRAFTCTRLRCFGCYRVTFTHVALFTHALHVFVTLPLRFGCCTFGYPFGYVHGLTVAQLPFVLPRPQLPQLRCFTPFPRYPVPRLVLRSQLPRFTQFTAAVTYYTDFGCSTPFAPHKTCAVCSVARRYRAAQLPTVRPALVGYRRFAPVPRFGSHSYAHTHLTACPVGWFAQFHTAAGPDRPRYVTRSSGSSCTHRLTCLPRWVGYLPSYYLTTLTRLRVLVVTFAFAFVLSFTFTCALALPHAPCLPCCRLLVAHPLPLPLRAFADSPCGFTFTAVRYLLPLRVPFATRYPTLFTPFTHAFGCWLV